MRWVERPPGRRRGGSAGWWDEVVEPVGKVVKWRERMRDERVWGRGWGGCEVGRVVVLILDSRVLEWSGKAILASFS